MNLTRGRVYLMDLGYADGPKHMLVVSNNQRNTALQESLAVRITSSVKPALPSIVELPAGEVLGGRVLCDKITVVYPDEVLSETGALRPATMRSVEGGLKHALGM